MTATTLDLIDRKIVSALMHDATQPIGRIADQVGLSQTPCWKRIQKLEARVDARLFDHDLRSGLGLTSSGRRMEPLARGALERLQEFEQFIDTPHTPTTTELR